jgi:5-methyltetrahydrofolate--homocysteine methyltransferase
MIRGMNQAAKERIEAWWNHSGLVSAIVPPRFGVDENMTCEGSYLHPQESARRRDMAARSHRWHGESVPHVSTYIGPGSLAIFLGGEPETVGGGVWFHEPEEWSGEPDTLRFDENNVWWRRTERLIAAMQELNRDGAYLIACPDLVENWDILASLMGVTNLLMRMVDDPDWVEAAIGKVNGVYFDVFDRLYTMIREEDGGMMYGPFMLYGGGRTAKVQCDGSAMFSPEMFERFVLPSLKEQCAYLDRAMYHLDGTQCIVHLDQVLSLEDLDAVEWTPQAGAPQGTDEQWYPMYRKILESGKSVQVLVDDPSRVPELLNAIGTEGVFLLGYDLDGGRLAETVEKFR